MQCFPLLFCLRCAMLEQQKFQERGVTSRMEQENQLPQDALSALDEIDRLLHQMLMLAELSAGDGDVDRENLQKVLEHLQHKIDRIADRLEHI